jgi:hypothetical protein
VATRPAAPYAQPSMELGGSGLGDVPGTGPVSVESELRALSTAYAAAVDGLDGEGFSQLFVEDGELAVPALPDQLEPVVVRTGRDSLRRVPEGLRRYARTFHQMSNHRYSIEDDRATGEVLCVAHHQSAPATGSAEDPGALTDTVWYIRYVDDYRHTEQGWRFRRRELHLQWIEERPVLLAAPPDRSRRPAGRPDQPRG